MDKGKENDLQIRKNNRKKRRQRKKEIGMDMYIKNFLTK